MAIFTTTDRDNIKAAMITAATEGFASVSIGGQMVQNKSLDELRKILEMVNADLASDLPQFGLRFTQLVPPGTG